MKNDEKERVQRKGVRRRKRGKKRETLGKPYPHEEKKNEGKQRGTRATREYEKVNSSR